MKEGLRGYKTFPLIFNCYPFQGGKPPKEDIWILSFDYGIKEDIGRFRFPGGQQMGQAHMWRLKKLFETERRLSKE